MDVAYFRIKYRIHYLYYIVRPNPRIECGEQNLAKLSEKNNNMYTSMDAHIAHIHIHIYEDEYIHLESLNATEKKNGFICSTRTVQHTLFIFFFRFAISRIYMLSTFVCHDSVYPKAYMKPSSSFSVLCFLNHCISIYISVNTVCS